MTAPSRSALEQFAETWSSLREAVGVERPPDPRPPLPARRPPDGLDRAAVPLGGGLFVAAIVALALPGTLATLVALVLLLTAVALVARQSARAAAWRARRREHRRAYADELAELYDRYRVEADHDGEAFVLRLRRYEPSPLNRLGRAPKRLYRAVTVSEERFGPDEEIAGTERLAELQAQAEQREDAARAAYRRARDARERLRSLHGLAES